MSTHDLCQNPVWEGKELGRPIPESPHAISVALPRWQDVMGCEEGRPDVIGKLATGYPRFVVHSFVRALASRLGGEGACLPFPRCVWPSCARISSADRAGRPRGRFPGKASPAWRHLITLLAHYGELDWAESCGVSRYLIRISVGLEEVADLW
jgi:hypothetical protein